MQKAVCPWMCAVQPLMLNRCWCVQGYCFLVVCMTWACKMQKKLQLFLRSLVEVKRPRGRFWYQERLEGLNDRKHEIGCVMEWDAVGLPEAVTCAHAQTKSKGRIYLFKNGFQLNHYYGSQRWFVMTCIWELCSLKDELLLLQVGWEDASLPWLCEQLLWLGTTVGLSSYWHCLLWW